MKKVRMNISHFHFILCNLKIFGEIVIPYFIGFLIKLNIDQNKYSRPIVYLYYQLCVISTELSLPYRLI